jgi:serine/threonine protein kinase
MIQVNTAENPRLYASVQRRYFSEKFRNFVDLCVERNSDLRPSAAQLLTHLYLKKSKQTNSILTTLQMSIVSDGLIALNKRIKAVRQPEENHQETNQIKELNKTSNFNSTPLFQWHF